MRKRMLSAVVVVLACAAVLAALGRAGTAADRHDMAMGSPVSEKLASELAASRIATAKYATDLSRAKQDGYGIITRMIPDMGWHFLNPKITGFDVRKPAILVYGKHAGTWQLVAYEWVFPKKPAKPPLPGATYGSFGAACHYKDGTSRLPGGSERLRGEEPADRCRLRVLASRPGDAPRLGLVPESRRRLRGDEPAHAPFQRRLTILCRLAPV